MRILTVLTYYRPHTSGLTIYAERLAKALVRRGHQVTVMTMQYDPALPREEMQEGVRILRVPVLMRVSKGVIAPGFGSMATRLVREHDIVQVHLPQFDAPGVALRGRLTGKPTILTYHCDLQLPEGLFNRLVNQVVIFMNHLAARLSDRIVTYTQDYADHSPYLSRYSQKLRIIPPPVELPPTALNAVEDFARQHQTADRRPTIGMAARLATEKGVEILLEALPRILEKYPNAQVLFAGQFQNVLGEQEYYQRLMPTIQRYMAQNHWGFLGVLNPSQMAAFYPNLDVLVVPSLNSTEAFGLVQIEAMMNGTPCVASSLPGVRQPIRSTGMGEVVPIGDSIALADAILRIVDNSDQYHGDPRAIAQRFAPEAIAAEYEALFVELLESKKQTQVINQLHE
jgi:glycosyltransferase involved in cell wall biosynthesis